MCIENKYVRNIWKITSIVCTGTAIAIFGGVKIPYIAPGIGTFHFATISLIAYGLYEIECLKGHIKCSSEGE